MAELISTKLIVIILVVLAVVATFFMIFRADILDWIRQLPEYKYDVDEKVDASESSDEGTGGSGLDCPGILVLEKRGWIKQHYVYINGEATNLYWKNNDKLRLYQPWSYVDIGEIINMEIGIYPRFLSESPEFNQYASELPALEDMNKLNGAFKLATENRLCKSKNE